MVAEKANVELLTALKQDANWQAEIDDAAADKKALGVAIGKSKDAAEKKAL